MESASSAVFLAVVQSDLDLIMRLRSVAEQIGVQLVASRSAEEAILYLRGVGVYSNRLRYPFPTAVLLDAENADRSDLTVLSWLRETDEFRDLPVGILTAEIPHEFHVLCALDPACFVLDRRTLADLTDLMVDRAVHGV